MLPGHGQEADVGPPVRIVIVAHEITEELRAAAESISETEMYEYDLGMDLKKVALESE